MRQYPGLLLVYPTKTQEFLFYSLTEELPTLFINNTKKEIAYFTISTMDLEDSTIFTFFIHYSKLTDFSTNCLLKFSRFSLGVVGFQQRLLAQGT